MTNVQYFRLDESFDAEYEHFLHQSPTTLLYASVAYRKLLTAYLEAEPVYLGAKDVHGRLLGVLPAFLKKNERHGNIINSLPFYGSNGGVIEHEGNAEVQKGLLKFFDEVARQLDCAATTIITSPLEPHGDLYQRQAVFDFKDQRIGQITPLPQQSESLANHLLSMFSDPRPRNIKKAVKSGVKIRWSRDSGDMDFLYDTHRQNILAIGGIPKERKFFDQVLATTPAENYKIYCADIEGQPVAALLLFYFNQTVEYFTPSILDGYRTQQPLSLLIFEAMKDAVVEGYRYWNWGGTWLTQSGVYDFKKRWGTVDHPYFYYSRLYRNELRTLTQAQLLSEYPNFYVLPFNQLKNCETI
jgi:hypothetical protein